MAFAVLACFRAWSDIFQIAAGDEEASQVWLALPVAAWIVWARWSDVQRTRPTYSLVGPAIVAVGTALHVVGFHQFVQAAWHGGAVLVALGAAATVAGPRLIARLWPALLALAFLVPVPGTLRQELALPLQTYTAAAAEFVFQLLGLRVDRAGNTLTYNGQAMLVAEACNGMRMMFALVLVAVAFAFTHPLRPWVRAVLIAISPLAAVLCNVIRVVPTVLLTGHYPDSAGPVFHDLAGWAMLALAFVLLMGFVRLLQWAELPVMAPTIKTEEATQHGSLASDFPENPDLKLDTPQQPRIPSAPILTGCLLVGLTLHATTLPQPDDAQPYHAAVRQAHQASPLSFGDWVGRDAEVPAAAIELLNPNLIVSRQFKNDRTRQWASLLIVHCKDARDLHGHWPPNCYPAAGDRLIDNKPRSWTLAGQTLAGQDFRFRSVDGDEYVVSNFLVIPNGTISGDMADVVDAAGNHGLRYFGAAQVQVLTDGSLDPTSRQHIVEEFLDAYRPLIQQIRDGPTPHASDAAASG